MTISLDNDVLAGDSSSHQLPGARGAAVVCGDNGAVIRPRSILIKWAGWHQAWRGTAEIIPGITLRIATLDTGYTTLIMGFPVYREPLFTHAVTAWVMSGL